MNWIHIQNQGMMKEVRMKAMDITYCTYAAEHNMKQHMHDTPAKVLQHHDSQPNHSQPAANNGYTLRKSKLQACKTVHHNHHQFIIQIQQKKSK